MTKNSIAKKNARFLSAFLLALLVLCIACVAPLAYIVAQRRQAYRVDIEATKSIAVQLGYTSQNHIDLYRTYGWSSYDIVRLIFYSEASLENFSTNVKSLGFAQEHYRYDTSATNRDFVPILLRGVVSFNNQRTFEDFGVDRPAPIVTKWELKNSEGRQIDIYYAETPTPQDVWLYDGQPLSGNVVVVAYHRDHRLDTSLFLPFENYGIED